MPRRARIRRLGSQLVLVVVAALVGAGAWAVAAPKTSTIKACAAKHGGALRLAKKCHKGERSVSWNVRGPKGVPGARGPQGPGATHLAFQASPNGNESSPYTNIGQIGEWTMLARCINNSAGEVQLDVKLYGEGGTEDASLTDFDSSNPGAGSTQVISSFVPTIPASSPGLFDLVHSPSGKKAGHRWDITVAYDNGPRIQTHIQDVVNNDTSLGQPVFCRLSAVTFPVR
jgi:hypothetical protein